MSQKIKKFYTLFLLVAFFSHTLLSQDKIQDDLQKTCLIALESGYGSGCFLLDSVNLYLVTARHNFYNKRNTKNKTFFVLNSAKSYVISYPHDVTKFNADTLILDLDSLEKAGLLKYNYQIDIAIVQLGKVERKNEHFEVHYNNGIGKKSNRKSAINGFSSIEIQKYNSVNLGDDVFIVGFPVALGVKDQPQFDIFRPLIRKGTIAGKSIDFKTIIIDCHVYGGNSGGPVIKHHKEMFFDKTGFGYVEWTKLIGIVTEFIPLEEVWWNTNYKIVNIEYDNSGYGVVVPIDYALDLIKDFK